MTRNLKILAVFSLFWSVAFFSLLHWALFDPEVRWPYILVASIIYGLGFALAGWQLGKRDSAHNTRINLGLWYACTSQVASLFVGGLWVLIFRRSEWPTLAIMAAFFTVVTVVASLSSRKTIKGIGKEKLFS